MKKRLLILLTFGLLFIGCHQNEVSLGPDFAPNYPLNFDFRTESIQGFPFGWDFRYPAILGFKHHVGEKGLTLSHNDTTEIASISYMIPGIYLSEHVLSVSVPFEVAGEDFKAPALTVNVKADFSESNEVEAEINAESSELVIRDLRIPANTKEVLITISFSGPNDFLLKPMRIALDGKTINALPLVKERAKEIEALGRHIQVLQSSSDDFVFDELIEKLESQQYILIGESVHAAKAFHEFKVLLTDALINRDDDIIVALEDDMYGIIQMMDKDTLSPETFNRSVYGVWASQEIYDFVSYVHKENASTEFFGIDVQNPRKVLDYLYAAFDDPERAVEKPGVLKHLDELLKDRKLGQLNQKALEDLYKEILSLNLDGVIADKKRRTLLDYSKEVLVDALKFSISPSQEFRDQIMAKNLRWLSETYGNGKKVIFWGHDGHIRLNEGGAGGYLKQMTNKKVFSVSLQVIDGHHKAYGFYDGKLGWGNSPLVTLPQGSLEQLIWHESGQRTAFLDFHDLKSAGMDSLLKKWRPVRSIGAAATDLGLNSWKIGTDVYDGVIVLPTTEAIKMPK